MNSVMALHLLQKRSKHRQNHHPNKESPRPTKKLPKKRAKFAREDVVAGKLVLVVEV
jgi:hypothetical protein